MDNLNKAIKEKCGKNNTIKRILLCMPAGVNDPVIPRPTKGAFVEFEYPRHAALAVQLNPVEVDGHTLELLKWFDGIERTERHNPSDEFKSCSTAYSAVEDKHEVMYVFTDSDDEKLVSKSLSDRTYASMACNQKRSYCDQSENSATKGFFQDKLEELMGKHQSLLSEYETCKQENNQLQEQNVDQKQKVSSLRGKLLSAQSENAALRLKNIEQNDELTKLRVKLREMEALLGTGCKVGVSGSNSVKKEDLKVE
jgi:hypothetical protein